MSIPTLDWVKQDLSWNTAGTDAYSNVVADSLGNVFLMLTSNADTDPFFIDASGTLTLVKLNSAGQIQWIKPQSELVQTASLAPNSNGFMYGSLAIDANDNLILALHMGANIAPGGTRADSNGDLAIFKINSSTGANIWVKQDLSFNSTRRDAYPSVTTDTTGNIYLMYLADSNEAILEGVTLYNNTYSGGNIVVVKFNSSGEKQWIKSEQSWNISKQYILTDFIFSSPQKYVAQRHIHTDNTNVYFTFLTDGAVSDATNQGSTDIIIVKLNATTGNTEWVKQDASWNTSNRDDIYGLIYVNNYLYLWNSWYHPSVVGGLFKINASDGTTVWVKSGMELGLSQYANNITSLAKDNNNDIYLAGIIDFNQSATGGTSAGNTDMFLMKIDQDGNTLWILQDPSFNTPGAENFQGFASISMPAIFATNTNIYVSYCTTNSVEGSTNAKKGGALTDIVLAKFSVTSAENNSITVIDASLNNPTTTNGTDGSILLDVSGGNGTYTFSWSGPSGFTSSSEDITSLGAGLYTVDISDSSGNNSNFSYTLYNPIFINDSSFSLVSVNDASDATITVDISGGNSIYTSYLWTKNGISYPDVSTNLTNLTSGIYVLTSVADASNSYFLTTGNSFTIPNPPYIPPGSNFGNPTIPPGTIITFPAGVSEELVFTEPSGTDLTNAINNIISISTDATLISKLQTGTNIVIVTLEPSGTTFSEYIGIPLTISSTSGLFVFYASGPSSELVPLNTPNYTDGPYYTVVNSGEIIGYTKHFSDLGFGNESGGVGDPFIKPIFGDAYYLPNDESTYLLLDNNSNLKIYTKTWIPKDLKKEMSFMRYIVFDYNFERFCLDLDSMTFVSPCDYNRYITHKLVNSNEPSIIGLTIDRTQYTNYFNDYYGKNYKVSGKNKQMKLQFKLENNSEIILQINSDLKYADIRNNVNIKFVNISKEQIKQFNGAFINEQKVKIIPHNSIVNKKTTLHKF